MSLWRTLVQWLFRTPKHSVITITQWPLQEPENKQEIQVEISTKPIVKLDTPDVKITHTPSERLH